VGVVFVERGARFDNRAYLAEMRALVLGAAADLLAGRGARERTAAAGRRTAARFSVDGYAAEVVAAYGEAMPS
jgi:hypothetical protein